MDILVYADWTEAENHPVPIGVLTAVRTKGHQVMSFEYEQDWIKKGLAQYIDPDLQFYSGPQYLNKGKVNFGLFMDSSPDRWGRTLMDRREAIDAREENRSPKKLFEEDYLLGVYDAHRMGGLRFKVKGDGRFQHDSNDFSVPPWASLRELEQATRAFESDMSNDGEVKKWINMLMAPGASLGGARPKASVSDENGHLWIAKFPSVNDTYNVGAWEMVANEMAQHVGIEIAQGMTRQFNSENNTFLSRRFDRTDQGERVHFASAMTLLGENDGATGVSYLQLAEFIIQQGAAVTADLQQLWRRIVFFIAIKNTDDHLRNHGFLLTANGWQLSPAYDVNPIWFGNGLSLNISETDNSLNYDLAIEVAKYFRINNKNAGEIIENTRKVVKEWRRIATKYKISQREQEKMAAAFEH